jgi:membrane-bound lytic murein transglycosylase A
MAGGSVHACIGLAFGLIAAACGQASAQLKFPNAQTETLKFSALPGWKDDDHLAAFQVFSKSCGAILQASLGRKSRPMLIGLHKACARAAALGTPDRDQARAFFEQNFKPVRILPGEHTYGFYTGADGFYTGYYEAEVTGSRIKTADYNVPIYRVPSRFVGRKATVFSKFDRTAIEGGALAGKGLEICWIKNPVDAFFAQIQGSTRVRLDDGQLLRLNYIASNGKPYTPVGRIMIDQGLCTPEDMSMDKIREYMESNPDAGRALREKNRSFVFFSETQLKPDDEPLGAEGIPLTPWRSLAVDPRMHVYGTPIWIDAKFPLTGEAPTDTFRHLMFAQDTGSAIRGVARADIYFGHGEDTPHIAGRIKQFGKFVMLVPNSLAASAPAPQAVKGIPMPMPRPRPKDVVADNLAAARKP